MLQLCLFRLAFRCGSVSGRTLPEQRPASCSLRPHPARRSCAFELKFILHRQEEQTQPARRALVLPSAVFSRPLTGGSLDSNQALPMWDGFLKQRVSPLPPSRLCYLFKIQLYWNAATPNHWRSLGKRLCDNSQAELREGDGAAHGARPVYHLAPPREPAVPDLGGQAYVWLSSAHTAQPGAGQPCSQ